MPTITDLLETAAASWPDRVYLRTDDDEYTFAETRRRALLAAGALRAHGIARGDRIVLSSANVPEFVFLLLGAATVGAPVLALDPDLTAGEVERLVGRAQPRLVVAGPGSQIVVPADQPQPQPLPAFAPADGHPESKGDSPDGPTPSDVAVFICTSGTTSTPKLVMQTHRGYVLGAQAFPWWLDLRDDDIMLTAMPLFHLNAQLYSVMGALSAGLTLVLPERFSARTFWDTVRRHGVTQFNAVGPMAEILLAQPETPSDNDNPVRLCYLAPALGPERNAEFCRRFGLDIVVGYGMSESPFGTIWPRGRTAPPDSIGLLRQHPDLGQINEARVVRADGSDVDTGEVGELLLRNPALTLGYFGSPAETRAALREGWLHTGDLVRQDDEGFFYHVGRSKEMIRHRGHNVAPAEVEQTLLSHPAVDEVAVVGVPSPLGEQDVLAVVVTAPGVPMAGLEAELDAYCRSRLVQYKCPRSFVLRELPLPRTATGRIAKHRLVPSDAPAATSGKAVPVAEAASIERPV